MAEGLQIGQLPQKENLTGNELIPFQQGKSEASRLFWCTNTNGTFNYHPSAIGYNTMMNDAIMKFIDSL